MNKYDDLQAILNALSDYTNKHNVDDKKHKEVYNAILSLTNTQTTTTKKTTKKAQSNDKKDIYDSWNKLIKSGMKEV